MTAPARDFGVQSYCFRHFEDNAVVARKVRDIGCDAIELCGVHVAFDEPERHAEAIAPYRDAGVRILSIGVLTFTGDEERERRWCAFARAAGARFVSAHFDVDSFQEAIPVAERLCEEHDLRLAIHCHGGYRFGGSADVLQHLLDRSGPRIGLCIDTAWCLQAAGDPVEWARRFAGRIHGVHYKDFVFDRAGRWRDVVVGEGNLDLPGFVAALEEGGFDGYAVLEYEADPEDPVPALRRCVERMRGVAPVA